MTNYERLIKEIATPRQYKAWLGRRMKMRKKDIAARLGVSPSAVSHLQRRLRKKIAKTKKLLELLKN